MDSSSEGTEPEDSDTEMVVGRKMMADRFLPGGRQNPPQEAPHPPAPCRRKRPHSLDEPVDSQEHAPSWTPPVQSTAPLIIQEMTQGSRPSAMVGSNIASSSAPPAVGWQNVFRIGNWPLLTTSNVRNWKKGEGDRVAWSLG